jgi:hypothetical protein
LGTLRGIPKGVLIGSVPKKKPEIQRQLTPVAARLIALVFLCLSIGIFIMAATVNIDPPSEWPVVAFMGVVAFVFALLAFFSSRVLPPGQLSTQMTSNEPKKRFWQWRARYVFTESAKLKKRS